MRYFQDEPELQTEKLTFENRFITVTFENYREKRKASTPMFEQFVIAEDSAEKIAEKLVQKNNAAASLFPSGLPVEAMLILADYVLAPATQRKLQMPDSVCLQAAQMIHEQSTKINEKYTGAGLLSGIRSMGEDKTHQAMREGDAKAIDITYKAIASKLSSSPAAG